MNKLTKGLYSAIILFGAVSCASDNNPWSGAAGEGKLSLNVVTDSRVMINTRADDTRVPVLPDPSEFKISMEKGDGTFSQSWDNTTQFNRETSFPVGTYTLSAEYGNHDTEGFDYPHFTGTREVVIESGVESHVEMRASLAHAMVSVRYTDDFISRFQAYSAAVKSETGSDYIIMTQNEERPAFMKPERINLRLSLTNGQGQQVNVSPYVFTAQPQHHYIVTVGVRDDNGVEDIRLDVQISEEVEAEFVDISLGDDLFNAPSPTMRAIDFPASMNYSDFEAFEPAGDPRIEILAYGGLRKVNLNIVTATPLIFGNSVQLVGADALTQAHVASTGLVAEGVYRNPDKAALLRFKEFLHKLPVGSYKITVDVEDVRTLVSEPVEFNVTVTPVTIELTVAEHPEYMGTAMKVNVKSNKQDVKNNIRFEVTNSKEQWIEAKILSLADSNTTRATEDEYNYVYELEIPEVEHYDVKVRAYYGSDTAPRAEITEDGVLFPEYTIQVDPFANKALIKVVPKDISKLPLIMNNLKVKMNGNEKNLTVYDEANGIFLMTGLLASHDYDPFDTYLSYIDNPNVASPSFRTESTPDLTNGSFDHDSRTINISGVQVGGQYRVSPVNYTLTSSIVCSTPDNWATLNDFTCWTGSSNKNTWFMVPSTYTDNGKVCIESVGYNHNGTTPATSGGAASTTYYCTNAPTDAQLNKKAGELFLGEYSYNGSDQRIDGIVWTTRPEYISFDYSYAPYNNEKGEVSVKVYDAGGTVIASGESLISTSPSEQNMRVRLNGYGFGMKAARLELCFRSTSSDTQPSVYIPTGSALNEHQRLGNHTLDANSYHAVAKGSKLIVDNVTLHYDTEGAPAIERKRNSKGIKKGNRSVGNKK